LTNIAKIKTLYINLYKYNFNKVAINFEILIINRGKDSGIVVISLEEYNSLIATNYELSNRTNESRLDSAIDKFKRGKSFSEDLIEE
jgi:antitoxin YefM